MMRASVFAVNPDSSRAAGTLLVTCEARTATRTSRPVRSCCSQPENAGIRHEGQQQGVVHGPQGAAVGAKGADQHGSKSKAIGQDPNYGQQTDDKQCQIKQYDAPIPRSIRRSRKTVCRESHRGFLADHSRPDQQQNQRNQRVGEHEPDKRSHAHAAFAVEVKVLRVADGGQHTAEVGCDGLHTDHRNQERAASICAQTAQYDEREGNKGQQGNIVGDEHTSEKAQPNKNEHRL